MNTWTPIYLSPGLEYRFDLLRELGIFSAMVAGFAFAPGIVAAHRHLQYLTHHRDRIDLLVISNELIPYGSVREKMPSASSETQVPKDNKTPLSPTSWHY